LVVFELAEGCRVAATFTRNAFCAAPVTLARQHLEQRAPRYLLINTGNANAGTGERGMRDALQSCEALAALTGVAVSAVLPFSTGVIGEPLPVDRLVAGLPAALENLSASHWHDAAEGIMTTDTLPKGVSRRIEINGVAVHISGISKGAGMIKPNMATMLGYVATDAPVAPAALQALVREAVEGSFNRITVDGDTSTNDACVLVASGRAALPEIQMGTAPFLILRQAIRDVFLELAHAIVRDGEGATKFIAVQVEGAGTTQEALDVAFTVAHSPLVKTALFASDPNWGRILAAVGRAGLAELDVARINIFLDEVCIVQGGARASDYTEAAGQKVMNRTDIMIRIELGRGEHAETVWTCDFSHDYVTINAEYRT
ncbi:MAG: bifunctional glutamate N-acetyltransferase/amino-acid acetyltransferase ArgJ, partial [Gammaproteobacteria bacterium]|nr:bifunctional glutamate N-acetyltransferase/amino-acid acetyltransferase ArgJ [Gammaproteobacteria bacterium]